jgi:uncharacterized protein (DUF2384 family)
MSLHEHNRQRVLALARRILGEKATEWLDAPRIQLAGRTPRQMLDTPEGCLRVEELLTQIDDDLRLHID